MQQDLFLDMNDVSEINPRIVIEDKINNFCTATASQSFYIPLKIYWYNTTRNIDVGIFQRRDSFHIVSPLPDLEDSLIKEGFHNIVPSSDGSCYIYLGDSI